MLPCPDCPVIWFQNSIKSVRFLPARTIQLAWSIISQQKTESWVIGIYYILCIIFIYITLRIIYSNDNLLCHLCTIPKIIPFTSHHSRWEISLPLPEVVAAILEVASTGATKAVHDDPPDQDVSPYACRVDTASAGVRWCSFETWPGTLVLCQETGIRAINLLPPPEIHTKRCVQVWNCGSYKLRRSSWEGASRKNSLEARCWDILLT